MKNKMYTYINGIENAKTIERTLLIVGLISGLCWLGLIWKMSFI